MEIGIISWLVIGLIAGILGKLIMPGRDPSGLLLTIVIGMIGALVGGLIVRLLGGTGLTEFGVWSILVATLGAVILLAIYRLFAGSRQTQSCAGSIREHNRIFDGKVGLDEGRHARLLGNLSWGRLASFRALVGRCRRTGRRGSAGGSSEP
jgi:uncharacterized membrane protein YeaQ/YmgE (transglycosylase-associated protein family)